MLGKHCQRFFRISHAAPSTWLQGSEQGARQDCHSGPGERTGTLPKFGNPLNRLPTIWQIRLASDLNGRPLACAARCQRKSHHLERRPPAVRESFDPVWARVVPRIAFREDDLRPSIVYLFPLAETHPGGDSALTNFVIGHTPSQNCGASPKLLR